MSEVILVCHDHFQIIAIPDALSKKYILDQHYSNCWNGTTDYRTYENQYSWVLPRQAIAAVIVFLLSYSKPKTITKLLWNLEPEFQNQLLILSKLHGCYLRYSLLDLDEGYVYEWSHFTKLWPKKFKIPTTWVKKNGFMYWKDSNRNKIYSKPSIIQVKFF